MSIKLMSAIFEAEFRDLEYIKDGQTRKTKASTAKLVLLAIADHANDDGEAYPGYTRLETKTALSRQGLSDTLDALKYNGLLVVDEKPSRLRTNNYTINIRCLPAIAKELPDIINPLDESSHLTIKSQATLPEIVKPLDHNHQLTINQPSTGAKPAPINLSIENQIAIGQEKIIMPSPDDTFKADCEIAVMNVCRGAVNLESLATEFITTRRIFPQKKQFSGWRSAFSEMYNAKPNRVYPQHVREAILQLTKAGMTVSDPFSIVKTAISLANPMPEEQISKLAEIAI